MDDFLIDRNRSSNIKTSHHAPTYRDDVNPVLAPTEVWESSPVDPKCESTPCRLGCEWLPDRQAHLTARKLPPHAMAPGSGVFHTHLPCIYVGAADPGNATAAHTGPWPFDPTFALTAPSPIISGCPLSCHWPGSLGTARLPP